MSTFSVQVRIAPPAGPTRVENVRVDAPSANHAKGQACYETQLANPGCRVAAADVFGVSPVEVIAVPMPASRCDCYGCSYVDNACGYRTCDDCLETCPDAVPVALEADVDRAAVRLCAACVALQVAS
jgi:hypothetical protein